MGVLQSLLLSDPNAAMKALIPNPNALSSEGFRQAADVFIESLRNGSVPFKSESFKAFRTFLSPYKSAEEAVALIDDIGRAYTSAFNKSASLQLYGFSRFKRDYASKNLSEWSTTNNTDLWLLDLNTRWNDSLSSKAVQSQLVDIQKKLSENKYTSSKVQGWKDARTELCSIDNMRQLMLLSNHSSKLRLVSYPSCPPITQAGIADLQLLRDLEISNLHAFIGNLSNAEIDEIFINDFKDAVTIKSKPAPGKPTWKFKTLANDLGISRLIGRSDEQKSVIEALTAFRASNADLKSATKLLLQFR